jgi:hypothetical protein
MKRAGLRRAVKNDLSHRGWILMEQSRDREGAVSRIGIFVSRGLSSNVQRPGLAETSTFPCVNGLPILSVRFLTVAALFDCGRSGFDEESAAECCMAFAVAFANAVLQNVAGVTRDVAHVPRSEAIHLCFEALHSQIRP